MRINKVLEAGGDTLNIGQIYKGNSKSQDLCNRTHVQKLKIQPFVVFVLLRGTNLLSQCHAIFMNFNSHNY